MKKYLILVFLIFFSLVTLISQSYLDFVIQSTSNADVVVEGVVIKQESYLANDGSIFTKNYLSYRDLLKGDERINGTEIIIETAGGKNGYEEDICFHCTKLSLNEIGVFFLVRIENQRYTLLNGNAGKIRKVNIDEYTQGIIPVLRKYVPDWNALIHSISSVSNGKDIGQEDLAPSKNELCFKVGDIKILDDQKIAAKIYVKSNVPNLKFASAEISIQYPASLGNFVVQSNSLNVNASDLISNNNLYSISFSDINEHEFKVKIEGGCSPNTNYSILGTTYQALVELILEVDISQIDDIISNSQLTEAQGKYYNASGGNCYNFPSICLDGELFVSLCNISSIDIIGEDGAGVGSIARFIGENFGDSPGKVKLPDADTDMENGIVLENLDETLLSWSDELVEIKITSDAMPGIMGSGKWRIDPAGLINFSCSEEVSIDFSVQKGTVTDVDENGNQIVESKPIMRYSLNSLDGAISFYLDNTINSNSDLIDQGLTFTEIELLVKQALCEWENKTGISLNYLGGIDPILNTNSNDAKNVIYFVDAATIQSASLGTHSAAFTTLTIITQPGCTEFFSGTPSDIQVKHPYSIDSRIAISQESNWYDKNSAGMIGSNEHDLFTIMLHEIGHSLGLNHSLDPDNNGFGDTRAMYPYIENNNDSKHSIDNGDSEGGMYVAQKSRDLLNSPNLITVVCTNDFALNDDKFCLISTVDKIVQKKASFKVIPNICLANTEVSIKNEFGSLTDFTVYNSLGDLIYKFNLSRDGSKVLKFEDMGVYFISAIVGNQFLTQKIIVQ